MTRNLSDSIELARADATVRNVSVSDRPTESIRDLMVFTLPPAEVAIHPAEGNDRHELFLMCTDLKAEISALATKGVHCSEVQEARWGSITRIQLPGGGELGIYQPKHLSALARPSS